MGLDMYAHAIKKDLMGDLQVDFDMNDVLGFTPGAEDETPEQATARYRFNKEATQLLRDQGVVDPDFAYWRKFNNLHGWMHDLYIAKGGKSEDFNCDWVRLMPEDIKLLKDQAKNLKPQVGSFWGETHEMSKEDTEEVLAFVKKCRKAFKDGYAVAYTSWW